MSLSLIHISDLGIGGCGRTGCLEAYCSATGVARTAREFLEKSDEPSLLREMNPEDITSVSYTQLHGDTNGIGYELIFKAFSEPEMLEYCTPIILSLIHI